MIVGYVHGYARMEVTATESNINEFVSESQHYIDAMVEENDRCCGFCGPPIRIYDSF